MNFNLLPYFLLLFILLLSSCKPRETPVSDTDKNHSTVISSSAKDSAKNTLHHAAIDKLEIPKTSANEEIVYHTGYTLSYNEQHEQANRVAYELTKAETQKTVERTNKFLPDPMVSTFSANDADYKGSGYDRGHLAPAADMGWSATAMAESFYYSNMSPQDKSFNRGIWKKLEEQVRTWAIENEAVYVVTGPVLQANLPTTGANGVSVPEYYYKVILDYTEPEIKGMGFVLRNCGSAQPLQTFACTIDNVEKLTGIDFFPLLPDSIETKTESSVCISCWSWKSIKISPDKESVKAGATVQCKGTTKAGNRCKRKTKNAGGYCFQHGG